MQSIHFHIAYLLTQHECVIVPGLGAFVVSSSEREKNDRWGIITPPETFLGFNSEIKHNDGLLVNSLAKERKCSYKEANQLTDKYITDILRLLDEGKQVHIPWVGTLHLTDNKKLFRPDRILSCNAFNYGLARFSLPLVKDLRQEHTNAPLLEKKNKEVVWIPVNRKLIAYSGSVAAALLAMCIIPTPLNNGRSDRVRTQSASVIGLPMNNPVSTAEEKVPSKPEIPTSVDPVSTYKKTETPPPTLETANPVKETGYSYYIIIASFPNELSAMKSLTEFRSKGFEHASILSSEGKHRIYSNRFVDKAEAENFLSRFKKDHPTNENAWLLKK